MRVTVALLVSLLDGVGAAAGEGIYDKDPDHLWNRVHEAIMVRTDGRGVYGRDNSVPFLEDGADLLEGAAHTNVMAVLDEFIRTKGETRAPKQGGLAARALLQHDLWAAFDVATQANLPALERPRRALRGRLARVIARLALTSQEWSKLPDNYEEAVRGGAFAKGYDPAHEERAFLPADLFDEKGPWVQVGDRSRLPVPAHVSALSGRSAFLVFIRCPGKRDETLAYLEKLNLHPTPWELKPAVIGVNSSDKSRDRWEPLHLDPKTPQFPAGTMVALVRQMIVLDDKLEPTATRLTQSVQFRVYKDVPFEPSAMRSADGVAKVQAFYELAMRRADLLAGRAGGFHPVAKDEAEYQMISFGRPMEETREGRLRGPVVMGTCANCHSRSGIFSVNTYTDFFGPKATNPQLPPIRRDEPDRQRRAAVQWKRKQMDWGMLRGLVEGEGMGTKMEDGR